LIRLGPAPSAPASCTGGAEGSDSPTVTAQTSRFPDVKTVKTASARAAVREVPGRWCLATESLKARVRLRPGLIRHSRRPGSLRGGSFVNPSRTAAACPVHSILRRHRHFRRSNPSPLPRRRLHTQFQTVPERLNGGLSRGSAVPAQPLVRR
jgi:hypothetical protein